MGRRGGSADRFDRRPEYQFGQIGSIALTTRGDVVVVDRQAVFHAGPEGTIRVQRVQAPGGLSNEEIEQYNFIEDFGAAEWDVFDRDGRFLGAVTMPGRFQPRLFTEDAVYGVSRDELDMQYVTRLRLRHGMNANQERRRPGRGPGPTS